jgi:hypothetical protein
MFGKLSFGIITGLMGALLLAGSPAAAQQASPQDTEISDAQLDQAAQAYMEITKIGESFREEIQTAEDEDERYQLQNRANNEMKQAVQDEGLEVQEYNEIIQGVQNDHETMKKFMAKLKELQ